MILNRSVFRSLCGVVVVGLLAVGCAGADGEQEAVGADGEQGAVGADGEQGAVGADGEQGPVGADGEQGPVGADGEQGSVGADGEQGPAGPGGPKGDTGSAGPKGDTGSAGSKGDTGSAGSKGDTGDAGPAGANGTADGSACTSAGGVVGTTVSGFDSSGLFSSYCVASPVATVTTFVAAASFREPSGVAFDGDGNLYVADTANHTIRKVTPAGVVTTFAGSGSSGSDDGTGTAASFNYPRGVAVDGDGNLYVADTNNNTIRKVTPAGEVTTFAGSGSYGSDDGTGTAASFANPRGVAVDGDGNLYVADTNNNTIRKVTPAGVVTTFAGSGSTGQMMGPAPQPASTSRKGWRLMGTATSTSPTPTTIRFARSLRPAW